MDCRQDSWSEHHRQADRHQLRQNGLKRLRHGAARAGLGRYWYGFQLHGALWLGRRRSARPRLCRPQEQHGRRRHQGHLGSTVRRLRPGAPRSGERQPLLQLLLRPGRPIHVEAGLRLPDVDVHMQLNVCRLGSEAKKSLLLRRPQHLP